MAQFNFELVSPEALLVSTQVHSVVVPGVEGEMTVLQNHSPVMLSLKTGLIRVEMETGQASKRWFIHGGGFADISQNDLIILAEHAVAEEALDWTQVELDIKNTKEDLADAKVAQDRQAAEKRLVYFHDLKEAFGK